jgi:hypothetical protein
MPNNFVEVRLHKPKKLQLIGGSRRIMPIGSELPSDIVLNLFPEMHRLDVGPKLPRSVASNVGLKIKSLL